MNEPNDMDELIRMRDKRKQRHTAPSNTTMETISNETAAKLIALHDAVWQLGNTLRDCMNRMDTIHGECPNFALDHEIRQCKHTLERYAKGPMFYKPHPFGFKYDSATKKDQRAGFPATDGEIKISML